MNCHENSFPSKSPVVSVLDVYSNYKHAVKNSWRTCLAECLIYRNKVELKFDNLARVRPVLSNDVSSTMRNMEKKIGGGESE